MPGETVGGGNGRAAGRAVFSFLYLKTIKISKIYVRFGKFQKYTPVALWGATGLKCNFFFFKFATKSLEEKKEGACRPPNVRQAPVAYPRGDRPVGPAYRRQGGWSPLPRATGGACRPHPPGRPGQPSLYKASPSFPPHLTSKNPPKIQKKEG